MFDMQCFNNFDLEYHFFSLLFAHASCVHDLLVFKEMMWNSYPLMIFVSTSYDKVYLNL